MNRPFTVEDVNRIFPLPAWLPDNGQERIVKDLNDHVAEYIDKQSGWVKCEDRLPTTFLETYNGTKSNLLVLLDDHGNTCIGRFFIQYYDGGKIESFYNEFEDEITGVTHYIELPVLP